MKRLLLLLLLSLPAFAQETAHLWVDGSDADECTNVIIQNNTVASGSTDIDCPAPGGGASTVIRGNILGTTGGCGDSATCTYNVFKTGVTVQGSNTQQCDPSYVDSGAFNYHLSSGDTCAANRGDPVNYSATDIDGQERSTPPEAGADELLASEKHSIKSGRGAKAVPR